MDILEYFLRQIFSTTVLNCLVNASIDPVVRDLFLLPIDDIGCRVEELFEEIALLE